MCPFCLAKIETDYRFCAQCRMSLDYFMTKCAACGEKFHSWFLPKQPRGCPFCGAEAAKLLFPPAELLTALSILCNVAEA